jgi:membrane protease YdiL (CAAX protease family)
MQSEALLLNIHPSLNFAIQYLILFVTLFFPLWVFVINKYQSTWKDFGFKKMPIKKLIAHVTAAYVAFFLIMSTIHLLTQKFNFALPGFEEQESYVPLFGEDAVGWIVAFVFVSILAPLVEEIFFRGFILKALTNNWPKVLGSVLTAALFAGIHFQPASFIPLFTLGLLMNHLYLKNGSIWAPIVFHSANNTIAYALELYILKHPEVLEPLEQQLSLLYNMTTLV